MCRGSTYWGQRRLKETVVYGLVQAQLLTWRISERKILIGVTPKSGSMKRKQKRKHLESTCSTQSVKKSRGNFSSNLNLQVLQHGHQGMPPTQDQTAGGDSSSDCSSGISKSPTNDLPPEYFFEDTPLLSEAKHTSSELEYLSGNSSLCRRSYAGDRETA
ncbi:uncharacterized protein LOC144216869 isoform X2 [Crocuta crocuta]